MTFLYFENPFTRERAAVSVDTTYWESRTERPGDPVRLLCEVLDYCFWCASLNGSDPVLACFHRRVCFAACYWFTICCSEPPPELSRGVLVYLKLSSSSHFVLHL